VEASVEDGQRTVCIGGELDLSTRVECFNACVNGDGDIVAVKAVAVELSTVTFMNCSGYGALVAARLALEQRGGSLSILNPTGQPAYLLGLIAGIEISDGATSSGHLTDHPPGALDHWLPAVAEPSKTVITRSIRRRLVKLSSLSSRRHAVATLPKTPQRPERKTIQQIQPIRNARPAAPPDDRNLRRRSGT